MIRQVEKEEVIRRGYEAARLRDTAAGAELLAPDAVWHSAIGPMLGKTVYVGYEEIADLVFREIPSVLEGFRPEVLEIRDLGGDMALAVVRWRATMRASGMEIDQVFGQLCRVRGGKWLELRSYESVEAAEAAIPEVRTRHVYADWNRGDFDGLLTASHPDVILEQDPRMPGAETVRGHDELRGWLERFSDFWDTFEMEPEMFVPTASGLTVVLRVRANPRVGGPELETRIAHSIEFRHGLIRRLRTFADPQDAPR